MLTEVRVDMIGLGGSERVEIPSNLEYETRFLTIYNMTDNSVCIYPPGIDSPTAGKSIICLGKYSVITIPVLPIIRRDLNVIYTNPLNTNPTLIKAVRLVFSEENLQMNQDFSSSYISGGDVVNVALVADDMHLNLEATQADILAKLSANPATEITLAAVLGKIIAAPATEGTIANILALMGFNSVVKPLSNIAANLATQITQAGVANKSWYIHYIDWMVSGTAAIGAANLAITLKDNAAVIYASGIPSASPNGTNLRLIFPQPIKITAGNSFTLDIETPNNANCILYSNIGVSNI